MNEHGWNERKIKITSRTEVTLDFRKVEIREKESLKSYGEINENELQASEN